LYVPADERTVTLPVVGSMLTALKVVEVLSEMGETLSKDTVCARAPHHGPSAAIKNIIDVHWRTQLDCKYDCINFSPKLE